LPPFSPHVFNSEKDASVLGTTQGIPIQASLQTRERIAYINSNVLDRRVRTQILFRVVGDNLFGWVEAALLWGGTIEMVTHKHKSNHRNCLQFNLPRYISHSQAYEVPPARSTWDGILLTTSRGREDAIDAGALFLKWQPLIALLALQPGLSRKERKILWKEFCAEGYK